MRLDLPLPVIAGIVMVGVALVFVGLGILAGFGDLGRGWGNAAVLAGAGAVMGAMSSGMRQADMKGPATLTAAGAAGSLLLAVAMVAAEVV